MKIVGSLIAAASARFPMEDVRPTAGVYLDRLTNLITQRYQFSIKPAPAGNLNFVFPGGIAGGTASPAALSTAASPQGAAFPSIYRNGRLTVNDEPISIPQLEFTFGLDTGQIVVQATTTEFADAVLSDLLNTLESELGFRDINVVATRQYVSNVVVIFDKGVEGSIEPLRSIMAILQRAFGLGDPGKIGLERISFNIDPALHPPGGPESRAFAIERRANHPYIENRYFSSASLTTSDHFEVLRKISDIFEGNS